MHGSVALVGAWVAAWATLSSARAVCPEATGITAVRCPTPSCSGSCTVAIWWTLVPGAVQYRLLRNTVNTTTGGTVLGVHSQAQLGNLSANFPIYDSAPPLAATYYYFVQTLVNPGPGCPLGIGSYAGPAVVAYTAPPTSPASVLVTSNPCSVQIQWTAAQNATGYRIYSGTTADPASASLLVGSSATQFVYSTQASRVQRYYWVAAYHACEPANESAWTAGGWGAATRAYPAPTAGVVATDGSRCDGVLLTWDACAGCDVYLVQRGLEVAFTTSATQWLDTSAEHGVEYVYDVCGYDSQCGNVFQCDSDLGFRAAQVAAPAAPSQLVTVGASAAISVPAAVPAGVNVQWHRNGELLQDGPRVSGAATRTLTIDPAHLEDAALYSYRLQTVCAETSPPTVLGVAVPCRADFNESGAVSVQDIFDFLEAFFAGCP